MLLKEMFSPIGGPNHDNQDVDWNSDLKLYIDDHDSLLNKFIMPAIEKHKKYAGHPMAYKIYLKPLSGCVKEYCKRFDIQDVNEIFTEEKLIELAKTYASMQEKFISKGDYEQGRK